MLSQRRLFHDPARYPMNSAAQAPVAGHAPNGLGSDQRPPVKFPYHTRFGGKELTPDELRIGALLYPERFTRPATRGECSDVPRPCPYVGCRHHLYLDVGAAGGVKLTTALEPSAMPAAYSCALDVADRGDHLLEEVGQILGVSRERARQIEAAALRKVLRLIRFQPEQFGELLEVFGG